MEKTQFIKSLKAEYACPFTGWDFSYLTANGRMQESKPPWNYRALVEKYLQKTESVLDMGTGGAEEKIGKNETVVMVMTGAGEKKLPRKEIEQATMISCKLNDIRRKLIKQLTQFKVLD